MSKSVLLYAYKKYDLPSADFHENPQQHYVQV